MSVQISEADLKPKEEFKPLADGDYSGVLVSFEEKQNSKNTGMRSILEFEIEVPKEGKKKLALGFNTKHTNELAESIGKKELAKTLLGMGLSMSESISIANDDSGGRGGAIVPKLSYKVPVVLTTKQKTNPKNGKVFAEIVNVSKK